MVKRKWYVVTVGRDIGVFPTWLDAGPLVKGVPNALHQSFTTREEATRVFTEEHAKGNTRIVDPDALPSVRQRARSASSASPVPSYSITSTPRTHFSDPGTRSDSHTSNFSRRHIVTPSQTPSSVCSSPLARSSSEPSPEGLRRLQAMQAALDEDSNSVGIQNHTTPQAPKFTSPWGGSSTRVSTSTRKSSRGFQRASTASPRMFGGCISSEPNSPPSSWTPSRAVVKTPSWLAPYPQAQSSASKPDEALSPLSSVDLKLNSFSVHDHHCSQSPVKSSKNLTPKQLQPESSLAANRTPNQESSSVGYSTIYLGSPVPSHHRVSHDIDPRSPILNQSQVPEIAYRSAYSFARPSPQGKYESLSCSPSSSHIRSSLLFKHDPSSLIKS